MCIVDHQNEIIRYFYKLNPSLGLYHSKCCFQIILGNFEMLTYRNGHQRIVHAETTRNIDLHIHVEFAGHMVFYPQISWSADEFHVGSTIICCFGKSNGFQFTGMTVQYHVKMFIINVCNAKSALTEQHPFACRIFFKTCMLIWSNMIRCQISENTDFKGDACCPVHHKSLRGYFHDAELAACLHHPCEILLNEVRLRCGIACRNMLLTDDNLDGAHKSHLIACMLENSFYHKSRGRLSLGSGNADNLHLLCRVVKPCS